MIRPYGKQRHRARPWIALVVAYVLVLQAMMAGLLAGAATASAGSAAAIICHSGDAATIPDHSGQQPGHSHIPSCCVLGCNMSGASTVPPPNAPSLAALRTFVRATVSPHAPDRIVPRRQQTLRSPRGPPPVA